MTLLNYIYAERTRCIGNLGKYMVNNAGTLFAGVRPTTARFWLAELACNPRTLFYRL